MTYSGFLVMYNPNYYANCERIVYKMVIWIWLFAFEFEVLVISRIMYNSRIIYSVAKNGILPSQRELQRIACTFIVLVGCLILAQIGFDLYMTIVNKMVADFDGEGN